MSTLHNIRTTHGQRGFSLIELLVAMLLTVFLLGVSLFVLSSNSISYKENIDQILIQDNARFSMDVLINDISMTGYYGCTRKLVNNLTPQPAGHLLDTTFPIDGYEQDAAAWAAQGNIDLVGQIKAGTDAVTIRKLWGKGVPMRANMAVADDPISASNVGFAAGSLAVIYNCDGANLFQATGVANDTVYHAAGGSFFPGNISTSFYKETGHSEPFPYQQSAYYLSDPAADPNGVRARTYIARFDAFRYYVADPPGGGGPGLWRQYYNPTKNAVVDEELIEGVEDMQILYFVEGPDLFMNADQVAAAVTGNAGWLSVSAIKINLLVRSVDELGAEINNATYDIHGTPDDPADDVGPFADRRRRSLVSTTILFRNRQFDAGSVNS